jgi:uncharacterized protein with GYD domain
MYARTVGYRMVAESEMTQTRKPKGFNMARYVTLIRFTEQGAKNIKKSTSRAHAFDRLAEKTGVKIVGQYWTMGQYDGLLIVRTPNSTHCIC